MGRRKHSLVALVILPLLWLTAAPQSVAQDQSDIRKTRVMITARDGVDLATDLYWPQQPPAAGALASILIRTPYGKQEAGSVADAQRFARDGFLVAVQDTRGHFGSQGIFGVMHRDAQDGYDTVDWLAGQSWSNGKVGTYGCSYRGAVQLHQATLRNPHLTTMIPQAAPGGGLGFAGGQPRYLGIHTGGAFVLASTMQFMLFAGEKIHFHPPRDIPRDQLSRLEKYFNPRPARPEVDLRQLLWSLPLLDMPSRAGFFPYNDWNDMVVADYGSRWWDKGFLTDRSVIDIPTLSINSWYDPNVAHTLYRFNLFKSNAANDRAKQNQFVIISPTQHCNSEEATEATVVGERNLGDARKDYYAIYRRWFEYWLLGKKNGITGMPKVQYYLMGKNQWRSSDRWPLPNTAYTKFYLTGRGRANSRFGDGALSLSAPADTQEKDVFVYDPGAPVPSKVGINGSYSGGPMAGPVDQRELEMRHDILVYTSDPMPEDTEVTGPVSVTLYVSSSAPDTDFTAKLLDVYPDGRAFNLTEGILRARYREGYDQPVWMEKGGVYKLSFQLRPTSNLFLRGHKIRLEISSSNFPRYDRNLNTGGRNYDESEWVVSTNTVHHSETYPSYVLLPLIY